MGGGATSISRFCRKLGGSTVQGVPELGKIERGSYFEMWYRSHGKRALDVLSVASGLLVLAPLILGLLVVLWVFQGRPVFFSQVRMGRNFSPFRIYKFRTMKMATVDRQAGFSPGLPDRRTPLGRILRKTKLDELPQLWNVLVGDMSLVGPRPEVPDWVDTEDSRWQVALSVRPGLTDYASLAFFDEEARLQVASDPDATYRFEVLPQKLLLAQSYVNELSIRTDLRIIMRTFMRLARP